MKHAFLALKEFLKHLLAYLFKYVCRNRNSATKDESKQNSQSQECDKNLCSKEDKYDTKSDQQPKG